MLEATRSKRYVGCICCNLVSNTNRMYLRYPLSSPGVKHSHETYTTKPCLRLVGCRHIEAGQIAAEGVQTPADIRGSDHGFALKKGREAGAHCIFVCLADLFSYNLFTYIRGKIFSNRPAITPARKRHRGHRPQQVDSIS